jgi:hypothetical protein
MVVIAVVAQVYVTLVPPEGTKDNVLFSSFVDSVITLPVHRQPVQRPCHGLRHVLVTGDAASDHRGHGECQQHRPQSH